MIVYLGSDISKKKVDNAVHYNNEVIYLGKIDNSIDGYNELNEQLSPYIANGATIHLIAEPTSTYHLGLVAYAYEQGWQVSLPNPKLIHDWSKGQGKRAKTDKIDARKLAEYGAKEQPTPQQPLPEEIAVLELLFDRKKTLEKNLQQEHNRLESFTQRSVICKAVLDCYKNAVKQLQEALDTIQTAIDQHIQSHPDIQQQQQHLLTVPGIGEKTVLPILIFLYRWDAYSNHEGTSDELTAFAGLDPCAFTSGSSVRRRSGISKQGDSQIRATLYMCARGGANAKDTVLTRFYKRLIDNKKPPKVALVACSRKILTWAFGVFRSGNEFNPRLASPKVKSTPSAQPV